MAGAAEIGRGRPKGMRILVADNDAVSRGLIRDVLGPHGYEILEACDGREALALIERTRPDLVLLDIEMPFLDGYAVLGALRSDPRFPNLPIVAVTALALQSERDKERSAGFDAYLTKPISPAVLRSQVKTLLN